MKLRRIAYAVPPQRFSSDEVAAWAGLDPAFVRDKVGIESRAFLKDDETPLQLAAQACERLFASAPELVRERIKLLVLVTQNPDFRLPHSAALLQHALKLPHDTACFDVNLGCSGYVYALSIAKGFMVAEGVDDALVVTCDPYSRIMGRADRDTIALFGDAASASWLSAEAGGEIGRLDFGTDGAGAENLIVRAGGAAKPLSSVNREALPDVPVRDYRLTMNGRGIFNFMMERIPTSVERCLRKNRLSRDEIDTFVFHQGSRFLLDNLRKKLGLDAVKVPSNLRDLGNTVSSSVPILLADLDAQQALRGRRVLISGFGVGLSWATNVIRF
jgi:3-oxoacyl-[acyl-carrier-protein] synthase-3